VALFFSLKNIFIDSLLRLELVASETFAPPKVSNTSKAVQGGGKKKKIFAALLLFPPP
jgi:hypothetical protein